MRPERTRSRSVGYGAEQVLADQLDQSYRTPSPQVFEILGLDARQIWGPSYGTDNCTYIFLESAHLLVDLSGQLVPLYASASTLHHRR